MDGLCRQRRNRLWNGSVEGCSRINGGQGPSRVTRDSFTTSQRGRRHNAGGPYFIPKYDEARAA